MRCPKCQYITFDSSDRCRNCGYQLSLSNSTEPLDLPIQTGEEPEGPLADLRLKGKTDEPAAATASNRPTPAIDLPLFGDRGRHDDRPLVSAPAVPRPPLAVRKPAPVVTRHAAAASRALRRDVHSEPELDLEPPEEVQPLAPAKPPVAVEESAASAPDATPAPASRRLLAATIDLLLLAAIDAGVLHFTLKICGLEYSEISVLPVAPFVAFLLLQNGGYFVAFTAAGGQTIGKMIAGLKVVPAGRESWNDRIPLGQAVLRTAACLVSALPAGLGFLPALVGADKRAIHDRLAHTRVVRV